MSWGLFGFLGVVSWDGWKGDGCEGDEVRLWLGRRKEKKI